MVAGQESRGFEGPDYHALHHQQTLEDGVGLSPAEVRARTIEYPSRGPDSSGPLPGEDPAEFWNRKTIERLPEDQLRTNQLGVKALRAALADAQAQRASAGPPLTPSEQLWALARRRAHDDRRRKQQ